MLSKAVAKYIISLQTKKGRNEHGAYVLEGEKLVLELLASQQSYQKIVVVDEWLNDNKSKLNFLNDDATLASAQALVVCSLSEMKKMTSLHTPSPLLAVATIPEQKPLPKLTDLTIVLDGLQDPGNLGTIIRTSDWFGLHNLIVSPDTVDVYNPKTVQAAMGSLFRVNIIERDLETVFKYYADVPVLAADMTGRDIRNVVLPKIAVLLIGNEGNGIKPHWKNYINEVISIPKFGNAESLNAAVATAILCYHWKLK